METLNVRLEGDQKELTIRTGDAPKLKDPKNIKINGTLAAPFQFLDGKKGIREDKDIHLKVFSNDGKFELVIGDQNADQSEHVITGILQRFEDLLLFAINGSKRWTVKEFLQFIRVNRFYFPDKSAHAALVASLQKWSVKVERVINEFNDQRGNTNYQLETKVQQSATTGEDKLIQKFDLVIPIFIGYEKVKFTVEIGLDPTNTDVKLFLFSDELVELEKTHRESIVRDELAKFEQWTFSKVFIN